MLSYFDSRYGSATDENGERPQRRRCRICLVIFIFVFLTFVQIYIFSECIFWLHLERIGLVCYALGLLLLTIFTTFADKLQFSYPYNWIVMAGAVEGLAIGAATAFMNFHFDGIIIGSFVMCFTILITVIAALTCFAKVDECHLRRNPLRCMVILAKLTLAILSVAVLFTFVFLVSILYEQLPASIFAFAAVTVIFLYAPYNRSEIGLPQLNYELTYIFVLYIDFWFMLMLHCAAAKKIMEDLGFVIALM